MSSTTIFSLPPEIFFTIGSYLDKRSLLHCLLVCHEWTSLFTPSFWGRVQTQNLLMTEYFPSPESLSALIHNSRHTHVLETNDPELLLTLTSQPHATVKGLKQLTFLPTSDQLPYSDNKWLEGIPGFDNPNVNALVATLEKATNIQQLTINESSFWDDRGDILLILSDKFPASSLQRLRLFFDQRASPPNYNYANPDKKLWNMAMDGLNRASDCLTQPPFTALKEFHIFGGYGFFSINRMAFLARCVNLESVWLEDVDNWFIDLVSYYFQFFCQRLTSLRLADSFGLVDQSIARILRASVSGWKELRLPSMEKFGPLSFEVLKRSTVTLEILEVEHWGVLDTRCFMDLLCNAGKLRRLGGIPDKGMDFEIVDVTVHAYCAFLEHSQGKNDLTWALGPSMEHLQMQIGGVPRPDVACRLNGGRLHLEPNGDIDASRRYDVQRWIYEQLGRMTGLQELLLGILDQNWDFYDGMGMDVNPEWNEQELEEALMGIYITFQYHCLEFSLESGLELLSGLKELRVLDIRSTAHRIGVPELEWMNVKWPKLKEVKGLYSCRGWTGDVEGNKAWEVAVNEWMAAHPNGIGCSYYS